MRINAKDAISRLGIRLREQRSRLIRDGEPEVPAAPVTDEELDGISEYSRYVYETSGLIRLENEALQAGDTARIALYFKRKQELLRILSLKQPAVEPFMKLVRPDVDLLKERLRELREELQLNSNLLAGAASASQVILSEVDRIRKRQSLEGVYDKSGRLRRDLEPRENRPLKKI